MASSPLNDPRGRLVFLCALCDPGGQRFTQWTLQPSDLVFKTFVVSSSPVPASSPFGLVLLLLGIAGAAFFILRR